MNILIISPGYLVQPAVNGGAIEVLIDTITCENEVFKKANFTIFSIYDGSKLTSNKNLYTNYKYIDITKFSYKLKRAIFGLINKIPNVYIGKAYIREIAKCIKKSSETYDAIIIENNPIFANIIRKVTNIPIILHLHNDYLNSNSKLASKTLKSIDHVLTVSNYIGNRVKTIDSDTSKVSTLYNGIDIKDFANTISSEEKNKIRQSYNLSKDDIVLLYTGRIMKQKGVKELIESFIMAKKKYSNLKLLIVGSSFFKNAKVSSYQKEIIKLSQGYEQDIIFTGYIEHKDIWKIYKICDIQVVPSIWGEPLATTVIEGMASGIPLIVNDVGGIPEMVDKSSAEFCKNNSLREDITKNISILIEDKLKRESNVKNALEKVNKFEKTLFYNNYIDAVSKIIGE